MAQQLRAPIDPPCVRCEGTRLIPLTFGDRQIDAAQRMQFFAAHLICFPKVFGQDGDALIDKVLAE